jgi:hypothetical protein
MDIRSPPKPLEEAYRDDPATSRITSVATGAQGAAPVSCWTEVGRAHTAEAHRGVGDEAYQASLARPAGPARGPA